MKNDFVMPIIVLTLICLFVSALLAIGNNFTQPVIAAAAAGRAGELRKEIIPQADGFEAVPLDNLPAALTAVYRTTNGAGYIFFVTAMGFGGEVKLICGIDPDGKVIRTAVLEHSETPGFGTPVFHESHASQYWGRDRDGIENVAVVSGSTVSSLAMKSGIRYALEAFDIITTQEARQ